MPVGVDHDPCSLGKAPTSDCPLAPHERRQESCSLLALLNGRRDVTAGSPDLGQIAGIGLQKFASRLVRVMEVASHWRSRPDDQADKGADKSGVQAAVHAVGSARGVSPGVGPEQGQIT